MRADSPSLEINGKTPVGEARVGPLADAPPIGGDLQNLSYLSKGEEIATGP